MHQVALAPVMFVVVVETVVTVSSVADANADGGGDDGPPVLALASVCVDCTRAGCTHVALENEGPSFSKMERPVFSRPFFTTPFVSKKYLRFQISFGFAPSSNNGLNKLGETSVKTLFLFRNF